MCLQIKKALEKVYCIRRLYKRDFDKYFFHEDYFLRRTFNDIRNLGKNEGTFFKN